LFHVPDTKKAWASYRLPSVTVFRRCLLAMFDHATDRSLVLIGFNEGSRRTRSIARGEDHSTTANLSSLSDVSAKPEQPQCVEPWMRRWRYKKPERYEWSFRHGDNDWYA